MLGLNIGRTKLAGLVPRKQDYAPRLPRIPLEHDLLPPVFGAPFRVCPRRSLEVAVRWFFRLRLCPRSPSVTSPSEALEKNPKNPPRSDPLFWMVLGPLSTQRQPALTPPADSHPNPCKPVLQNRSPGPTR